MVESLASQTRKEVSDLLKKGALDIARKDAEFLQKRIDALNKEMSLMTKLLAGTVPQNQGPILSGLEQLGDRLKSAGKAVEGFGSDRTSYFAKNLKEADTSEIKSLQQTLTQNYLNLSGNYTALGGGPSLKVGDTQNAVVIQKLIDKLT